MVGGFKHVFSIQLGMSSSQLTFSPSFFRGLGPRAQPASSIHSCDPRPRRPRTEEWPWVFCCVGHMRWEVFGSRRTHRAKWGEWGAPFGELSGSWVGISPTLEDGGISTMGVSECPVLGLLSHGVTWRRTRGEKAPMWDPDGCWHWKRRKPSGNLTHWKITMLNYLW